MFPAAKGEEGAKKTGGIKIKLGSIKISETSAALIQSGLKFDTKKQALLEEGEFIRFVHAPAVQAKSQHVGNLSADQTADGYSFLSVVPIV